jgi:hypothetical protein
LQTPQIPKREVKHNKLIRVSPGDFLFHLPHQPGFASLPGRPNGKVVAPFVGNTYELLKALLDKLTAL